MNSQPVSICSSLSPAIHTSVCVSVPRSCSLHSKMALGAQVYVWLYLNNFIVLRVRCLRGFCLCRAPPHPVTVLFTLQAHEMGKPGSIFLCCPKKNPNISSKVSFVQGGPTRMNSQYGALSHCLGALPPGMSDSGKAGLPHRPVETISQGGWMGLVYRIN